MRRRRPWLWLPIFEETRQFCSNLHESGDRHGEGGKTYLRNVTAVSDFAFVGGCRNQIHGLVLIFGADGLDGLTDGLCVGGNGDLNNQRLGVLVLFKVLVDCVEDLLVLCLERSLLVLGVVLGIVVSVHSLFMKRMGGESYLHDLGESLLELGLSDCGHGHLTELNLNLLALLLLFGTV